MKILKFKKFRLIKNITFIFLFLFSLIENSILIYTNSQINYKENNFTNNYNLISSNNSSQNSQFNNQYLDLIDGIIQESDYGNNVSVNQEIPLNLNQSSLTFGMELAIKDINETKEYISNNQFSNNISMWNYINDTDIKLSWKNEYENKQGIAILNITGLETPHLFTRYNDSGNLYETFKELGNWQFENITNETEPYIGGGFSYIGDTNPQFNCTYGSLEFSLSQSGMIYPNPINRSAIAYTNFTYNGTYNILDMELFFSYFLKIESVSNEWNSNTMGDINLSVYIKTPNGNEYKIDNWILNLHGNITTRNLETGSINGSWPQKIFNLSNLKDIIKEQGNYTLIFRSDHYHNLDGVSGMISSTKIDNIKLVITYSYKEFNSGENISLYQNFIFIKMPIYTSILSLTYCITSPFLLLNNSDAEIFAKINNNTHYSKKINEIQSNSWYNEILNLDPEYFSNLNESQIKVELGIRMINDSVIFYPNDTFSLIVDEISLIMKGCPYPNQINLSINFPFLYKSYHPINEDYGKGVVIIENYSIWWVGNFESNFYNYNNLNCSIIFVSNSNNITLNYEIIKYMFSWRDVVYNEFIYIKNKLINYLNDSLNSIIQLDFLPSLIEPLFKLINETSRGQYDNALKYATLISQQFPILYKSLIDELNGSFNIWYNSINSDKYFKFSQPINYFSLNTYNTVQDLFRDITNLLNYFKDYNFDSSIMFPYYKALYSSYIAVIESKMNEIKSTLINSNLSLNQINNFKLSNIYFSIQNMKKSIDSLINGLDVFFNVDPDNFLLNWYSSEDEKINFINEQTGIYLGNIPYIISIINRLYNNSFFEYWKHTSIWEFITSNKIDFSNPNSLLSTPILSLGENLFGIYGNINLESDEFKKINIPISIRDNVYYSILKVIIEDFIIRKNAPLGLEYSFKSIFSAINKIIKSSEDKNMFNNTKYEGNIYFNISNFIDSKTSSKSSTIKIQNLGNSTDIKIKLFYYIPTNYGLKLIEIQTYHYPNTVFTNEFIQFNIPITAPDNIYILSLLSNAFGITNCSLKYFLIQKIYFNNKLIIEHSNSLSFVLESTLNGRSIMDIGNKLYESIISNDYFTQFNTNHNLFKFNISSYIYNNNITFEQIKNQLITVIIQRNDSKNFIYNTYYTNFSIGNKIFYWNSSNLKIFNNFSTINVYFDIYTGISIITFKIYKVLEELGLDVSAKNFESYFTFNIYTFNCFNNLDIKISLISLKQLEFFPIWFNNFDQIILYNDLNLKLNINFPFIELSGKSYYKIDSFELIYSYKLFYPNYNSIVPNYKIQNQYFNSFFQITPIKYIENIQTPIIMKTLIKFENGSTLNLQHEINLYTVKIYHFKDPITPNILIALTFSSIILITMLFITRIYKRYSLFFIYNKNKRKLKNSEKLY